MRYSWQLGWLVFAAAACGTSNSETFRPTGSQDASTAKDASPRFDVLVEAQSDTLPVFDAPQADVLPGCDPQTFELKQGAPALVSLVVDSSGSMAWPGSSPSVTRWDELKTGVGTAVKQYEASIAFGLFLYPSDSSCSVASQKVANKLRNHTAISDALEATLPNGGTPTAMALTKAAEVLAATDSDGAAKLIILATDGGPNCNFNMDFDWTCQCTYASPEYCCTQYPDYDCFDRTQCLDDLNTIQVVKGLRTGKGIDTVVIGLPGTSQYEQLLNQLAQEGGRARAGATKYYEAKTASALASVLQSISVTVVSCSLELSEAPKFPESVQVFLDGQAVAHDPTRAQGWEYKDDTHLVIELHGQACETLRAGGTHKVTATFACEAK